MKIYIPNALKDPNTLSGKSLFCHRLGKVLLTMGVDVVDDVEVETDLSLNIIRLEHSRSKIKILRLDGIWHDTGKNYIAKNKNISANDIFISIYSCSYLYKPDNILNC